jgi:hypothetical protein
MIEIVQTDIFVDSEYHFINFWPDGSYRCSTMKRHKDSPTEIHWGSNPLFDGEDVGTIRIQKTERLTKQEAEDRRNALMIRESL